MALCLASTGCTSEDEEEVLELAADTTKADGPAGAQLRRIAGPAQGLDGPADLAWNPRMADQLWVVNRHDDSVVIISNATRSTGRRSEYRKDGYSTHFMAMPMSISFGADPTTFGVPGTFATCGESRNTYGGSAPHNDFMGPVLWSSDLRIFAKRNPYGLGSHIDMMHETPNCMGIEHEKDNVFWAVGGLQEGIFRYDFMRDHNIGRDDHSDGAVWLYAAHQLRRVPNVPMHMAYSGGMLYVADSGNSRVVKLDTRTGRAASGLAAPEPLRGATTMVGAQLTEVVRGIGGVLDTPSGLALAGNELWVSDNSTGRISVFNLSGTRLRYYETGLGHGALAGIEMGPDRRLYVTDLMGSRVFRLEPR